MYSIVNKVYFGYTKDLHIDSEYFEPNFYGLEGFLFYDQLSVIFTTYKHSFSRQFGLLAQYTLSQYFLLL